MVVSQINDILLAIKLDLIRLSCMKRDIYSRREGQPQSVLGVSCALQQLATRHDLSSTQEISLEMTLII